MEEGGARAPIAPLRQHHKQQAALRAPPGAPPAGTSAHFPGQGQGQAIHRPQQQQQQQRPQPPPRTRTQPTDPRIHLLQRSEGHGFGFTLRHLIVYPPESYSDLFYDGRHAAVGAVDEPMDTIFVKSVLSGGAAHRAGVRPGDRLLAVDGHSVATWPYAHLVHYIQRAPRLLKLHVVPKEADVLQKYFSEAAYNPETNQRPQNKSRERRTSTGEMPLARETLGMAANGSAGGAHTPYATPAHLHYRPINPDNIRPLDYSAPAEQQPRLTMDRRKIDARNNIPDNGIREFMERIHPGILPGSGSDISAKAAEARSHVPLNDATRAMRRSSEGARIQAESSPYYGSPPSSPFNSSRDSNSVYNSGESMNSYRNQRPHVGNDYPASSTPLNQLRLTNSTNGRVLQYPDNLPAQYTNRFNYDDRRESNTSLTSSAAESKDSMSSYESISTVTGQETDDSIFLSRIRKSLEQKEAFLRRPSQPTGWVTPDDPTSGVIQQKEFYPRPQKLHKSVWPPSYPADHSLLKDKENIQDNVQPVSDFSAIDGEIVNHAGAVQSSDPLSGAVNSDSNKSSAAKQKHDKNAFVCTLSKIHENTSVSNDSCGSMTNGSPASPNSLEAMLQDKRYPIAPEVQIVTNRTKQFESQPPGDRTAMYKSELARLSTKKPEPTVALRRKEFESRGGKRDAKSLEAQQSLEDADMTDPNLSGNQMVITGSKYLTCPPPEGYSPESERVPVRMRSNSTGSEGLPTRRTHASGISMDDGVIRRQKNASNLGDEEERAMRRVSYLKATWGDRVHADSDQELSDTESQLLKSDKKGREEFIHEAGPVIPDDLETADISMQGNVQVKMVLTKTKRASDRSWKHVWAVLQGPKLTLYRNQHQSPTAGGSSESLNLRFSMADVAGDYTKRKHVVRVTSIAGTELLLQAGGAAEAAKWLHALRAQTPGGQVAEPQQASDSPAEACEVSPPPRTKKPANIRTMSPTENSTTSLTASPKSKTWKGRVARQLRRMQAGSGGPGSGHSPNSSHPAGALPGGVGVTLESCVPLPGHPLVPHLVGLCTNAVEERGLQVVGVYRVPGNTASVTTLQDSLERGIPPDLQDPKWSDVNVVSSLLKAFFRRLPNPLLTKELYPKFISADKDPDSRHRVRKIRKLVRILPDHHYETLKFLMEHLKRVVAESAINKMEAKNLAIVFGPTLVRSADDNMFTMVNDMSSQCRIIESLINNMEWYFDEEDRSSPVNDILYDEELPSTTSNQALLLQNVKKIEGKTDVSTKDIVSSIISAANRKIQRKPRSKPQHVQNENNSPSHQQKERETVDKAPPPLSLSHQDVQLSQQPAAPLVSPSHNPADPIIKSYHGLNETTLERVKRFEMETIAVLQRDKRRDPTNDWQNNVRQETSSPVPPGNFNPAPSETETAEYISRSNPSYYKGNGESNSTGKRLKTDSKTRDSDRYSDGMADMVSSLTSTFDQKLRSLHTSSPLHETIPYVDESHEETQDFADPSLHRGADVSITPDNGTKKISKSPEIINEIETAEAKLTPKRNSYETSPIDSAPADSIKELDENEKELTQSFRKESAGNKIAQFAKNIEKETESEKDVDITSVNSSPTGVIPDNDKNIEKFIYHKSFQEDSEREYKSDLKEHKSHDSTAKSTLHDMFFKKSNFNPEKSDSLNVSLLVKSKLKRSESLNRETEKQIIKNNNKLIISENFINNKNEACDSGIDVEKSNSPKLRRSVSLNRSDIKLKRSDSLTKSEKTETNLIKRREIYGLNRASAKLKRKNGMPERSIKRRHTVGGTKDFDKDEWVALGCSRTSSPDLPASILDGPVQPHVSPVPLESHV